jgi:hypothetical protein
MPAQDRTGTKRTDASLESQLPAPFLHATFAGAGHFFDSFFTVHGGLMRTSLGLAAGLASLALAGTANAADNGFYLGVGVGQSNVDIDSATVHVDGDDTGFKAIAGFRPLDSFGVEVNYVDFGKIE